MPMTRTVQSIVTTLSDQLLNDTAQIRWTEDELVSWVNEAQLLIVSLAAEANTVRTVLNLTAGSRQTLPYQALRLIDVIRSLNSVNSTVAPVRHSQKKYVTVIQRDFYSSDPERQVNNIRDYFYEEAYPREFEVYPPARATAQLEIVYSAYPVAVTITDIITVEDAYAPCIIDYVAYRAFSKDTEDVSADLGRAQVFYNQFAIGVGAKDIGDLRGEPVNLDPRNGTS